MKYTIDQIKNWLDKAGAPAWVLMQCDERHLNASNRDASSDDDDEEEDDDGKPGAAPIASEYDTHEAIKKHTKGWT